MFSIPPDFASTVLFSLSIIIGLRVLHRLYYVVKGHTHYLTYSPRDAMESFFAEENITTLDFGFKSKADGVNLKYRRLGKGSKVILLVNGVGTDLFMWFPTLKFLKQRLPSFFDEFTIVAYSYRGLFGSLGDDPNNDVAITIDKVAEDIQELKAHGKFESFHLMMGWSMGAQSTITCCAKYPDTAHRLFLLNPSAGLTLHGALQPFIPMPAIVGQTLSSGIKSGIRLLRPLCSQPIWDFLAQVAFSTPFRMALETSSFLGGFPPEQGVYFHEYMRDVFKSRHQTRGLLDLLVALDDPCPPTALTLPHPAVIVSGVPDFMTGVYVSTMLERGMKNSRHVKFNMASHFLLIEWPELLADEILKAAYAPSSPVK